MNEDRNTARQSFFSRVFAGSTEGEGTSIYSSEEIGMPGTDDSEGLAAHGFTVERAAEVIRNLPPEVPRPAAVRIVRGTLEAAQAALALAPHGLKDLVLAHLSKTNNSPARACGTVHRALREAGHGGIRVRAALAGHPTPPIEVGTPLENHEYIYRYERHSRAEQLFDIE
jgi:hypothetical protein